MATAITSLTLQTKYILQLTFSFLLANYANVTSLNSWFDCDNLSRNRRYHAYKSKYPLKSWIYILIISEIINKTNIIMKADFNQSIYWLIHNSEITLSIIKLIK